MSFPYNLVRYEGLTLVALGEPVVRPTLLYILVLRVTEPLYDIDEECIEYRV